MLGSSLIDNFLLTMSGPYGLSRASEVHQRNPWEFTHLKFENRSNTARSRFLQSSALPDKAVQFQLSWGKQWREPAVRWFGLSFASVPKCKERFARHPSQAQFTILRVLILMLLQALSRSLAVAGAHVQAFTFIALAPNTTRNKDTTQTTHTNTHNTRRQTQRKRRESDVCCSKHLTFQNGWRICPSWW